LRSGWTGCGAGTGPGCCVSGTPARHVPRRGVGINLAVQDAVAAARLLAPALLHSVCARTTGDPPPIRGVDAACARVQRRRCPPTAATQLLQRIAHRWILAHGSPRPGPGAGRAPGRCPPGCWPPDPPCKPSPHGSSASASAPNTPPPSPGPAPPTARARRTGEAPLSRRAVTTPGHRPGLGDRTDGVRARVIGPADARASRGRPSEGLPTCGAQPLATADHRLDTRWLRSRKAMRGPRASRISHVGGRPDGAADRLGEDRGEPRPGQRLVVGHVVLVSAA
jgi:hypothetical protein